MGGSLSACAGKGSLCTEKKKKKKEPKPERFPKKRKRKEKKLAEDVDGQKVSISELRTEAAELTPKLSQHDKELVDERIRDIEHKHGNLESNIQHKIKGYGILETDLDGIKGEADRYLEWLDQCDGELRQEGPLGHKVEEVEVKLEAVKDLETQLSQRQTTLEAVNQKAQVLITDLPSQEKENIEKLIASVQTRHNELYGSATEKCRVLEEMVDERREFYERLERQKKWLDEKQNEVEAFDTIRLVASEVDRQLDKCKSLVAKVQSQSERVNEIKTKADTLKQKCDDEAKEKIDQVVEELCSQHEALLQRLKQQQNNLRDCSSSRKRFEGDCQKIDRWCRETQIECERELPLDCAVEILEEEHKVYKNLTNAVQVFHSLMEETKELGESYFPTLFEADKPVLQEQLESLQQKFDRVCKQVQERNQSLEDIIKDRSHIQTQITSTEEWLKTLQSEIKQSSVPIGCEVNDAELLLKVYESIEEKLSNYQSSMQDLSSHVEKLREDGQHTQADDIARLTDLYQSLKAQVHQHTETCRAAVGMRRSFEDLLIEQEARVKECEDEIDEVASLSLSVPERMSKYKTVLETLQKQEPELLVATEKAGLIGKQGTEDDLATVIGRVGSLNKRVEVLKTIIQEHLTQCEIIQRERESFEAAVTDVVSWFEEKEDVLATCKTLHLDSDKVTPVLEKHKVTSTEAREKLQSIKETAEMERKQFETMTEPLPMEFSQKLEQIKSLEDSIVVAISKKEEYLHEAQADRVQFENSMRQVFDWLRGAEDLLDSGYDGLDYDTLESTLGEFTDYFSEASLCQDEIEQVTELSERILPTLDENDTATMKQTLKNVSRKYTGVMTASQNRQATMEQKVAQWTKFQEDLSEMNGKLDVLETEWEEVNKNTDASPESVQTHLELVKTFLEHAETSRIQIDNLNELARDLDRMANTSNRTVIDRLIGSVNRRWEQLIGQAESRVLSLEEIEGQWGDFTAMMSSVQTLMQDSETRMSIVSTEVSTHSELCTQLSILKEIAQNLERTEPQVARLQSSSLTLQKALPTAEAKISSQEHFMVLVERYERLVERVKEETASIQEETENRERLLTEVDQAILWYKETLADVQVTEAKPERENLYEILTRHRVYGQELHIRVEQMRKLELSQESKYSSEGRELPTEMKERFTELHALETELSTLLKEKEEELVHIKEDREEYKAILRIVTSWLQRADMQLQEKIFSIPQAREKHQSFLLEFDEFKTKLDQLRTKGGDIIRHSPEPEEKQTVQKTLADINRQWLSLQAQSADRTQELSEAADLSHAIDDVANGVQVWAEQAEAVIGEELAWTDFDRLKDQLKAHRKVHKEIDSNQDKVIALNAMVKQLEQVCESPDTMVRVGELKQRVATIQTKAGVQLSTLEDANQKMENFEREVSDLMRWLEQTRARMTMRDTTTDLRNQLAVQERVYRFMLTSCDEEVFGEV